ncbi:OmpA family protein [Commensalibacter nepenthis]|uniref:OmpA family protein n=1 Tax=Commensalibacter nepenthis TaxID=3043872 RepID=A0ABT6Q4B9_9PROT|nr:OmpA family protein [Commensalibacter sp. TBRC 10068]MDI2111741.1 OmpA family protein [Commensalibacter sp. TBRC 10068]
MSTTLKRILWLLACLLISIFCFIFVINNKVLLAALLIFCLVVAIISWIKLGKISRNLQSSNKLNDIIDKLPSPAYRQPIILAYKNSEQSLFDISDRTRQTDHGFYIFVNNLNEIDDVVEALLIERPSWHNQISTLMITLAEQQSDKAALMGQLHEYFYQISRVKKLTKSNISSLVVTCLDGVQSPWFEMVALDKKLTVWTNGQTPVHYKDWILNGQDSEKRKRLFQILHINAWLQWFNHNVVQEYINNEPDYMYVPPTSIGMIFTSVEVKDNNLWEQWVKETISLPRVDRSVDKENTILLPNFMIRLLPHQSGYHPITKAITYAIGLACIFLGSSFLGAYINNKHLLRSISHDINRFYQIPDAKEGDKKDAFIQLQKDAALLDQYYRDGTPLYLDMGLYMGEAIMPPLLKAINSYNPPKFVPSSVSPKPEGLINFDSMALFDVGKSVLKPGSTKILIKALLQIKAKPGWLILITGHTDSTGNEELNQQLSRERAEAVQNWMVQNSDIPSTCFAVQGEGSKQPIADNSTDAGRAANRRVEVRLIPDKSSACRVISRGSSDQKASLNQGDK